MTIDSTSTIDSTVTEWIAVELPSAHIDGEWVATRGEEIVVDDPAGGGTVGRLASCEGADVAQALAAASGAAGEWRRTDPWRRSAVLRDVARILRDDETLLAQVLTAEQGKPLAQAAAEVRAAADHFDWCADEARRIYGRVVESRSAADRLLVRREPIGVVGAFTPWNFPSLLPARKIAAALAAGCTMVLKPAEETPFSALALARAARLAGLPPGVLNVVVGDPADISRRVLADDAVRKVALTGSVAVGKELMRLAADGMKSVSMELGGHAPVLVFPDVDPVRAGVACAEAKFRNAGQVCIAATRFLVHESIAAPFLASFTDRTRALRVGPGSHPDTEVGPLTNARRVEAVDGLIGDACAHGARLVTGGRRPSARPTGNFYEPTVLADVRSDMAIMHVEPFGPVAPITTFADTEEAVAIANAVPYGLAGYVLTNDLGTAFQASEALEVGMVGVNSFAIATAEAPFGGVKLSGNGREGGPEGVLDYTVAKYVSMRVTGI